MTEHLLCLLNVFGGYFKSILIYSGLKIYYGFIWYLSVKQKEQNVLPVCLNLCTDKKSHCFKTFN